MYQALDGNHVRRLADGAIIPTDPANRDFQEFSRWLAAGGVLQPAPVPVATPPTKLEAALIRKGIIGLADLA